MTRGWGSYSTAKQHRALLCTGRLARVLSYAQLDETVPVLPRLRISGLDPDQTYLASLVAPPGPSVTWEVSPVSCSLPISGRTNAVKSLSGRSP
ncbi:hypothetical protein [Streptomyces sp. RP5T]|uniref:hypothetical protein n=1 Tax=Streptomyces sp. RP5T TaxID=2490848 RepID=UPI0021AE0D26|nr:hypothetical protein [Streptomyces sp. RP5T]